MNWFIKVLKDYANFSGRARREEFWMFTLISFLINIGLSIIIFMIPDLYLISSLYSLIIIVPTLAVTARRLHDIGKSAWNFLFILIPLVGIILLIVWWAQDSQHGPNQWGDNPKGLGNSGDINLIGRD
ncbi:DUF805 domain-containing protein [Tenacibaculum jejuense]|uniref:DUF805 domain-containing protein n=1 Tax=Tenacibaculum jejuense TaxID=584609 RepID=A0A238U9T2_9FLAO|nr:DUF805 domain-containing protein [Tenacibaculum jejuense]SNR15963.1 Probable transmembrane protein of unknown function [Tenacibaculum jejuense]